MSLGMKHKDWEYEEEVRIIQESGAYYILPSPVMRVIVGSRIDLELLDELRQIQNTRPGFDIHQIYYENDIIQTKSIQ